MKNNARIAAALLFAVSSTACQGTSAPLTFPTASSPDSSSSSATVASPLYGVTWRLQEINSKKALPGVSVTAVFGAEKTLSGSGGCNRYSGGAIANDGKLTVTPLATTMMFCGQAGVADQEVAYFSALGKATAYSVTDTELRLTGGASGAPLVFARE